MITVFIFNLQIRAYFYPHAYGYRKIGFGPVLVPRTSNGQDESNKNNNNRSKNNDDDDDVVETQEWTLTLGSGEDNGKQDSMRFKPFRTRSGGK